MRRMQARRENVVYLQNCRARQGGISRFFADLLFYQESGGGVTLSRGEPLAQPEFAAGILTKCRDAGFQWKHWKAKYAGEDFLYV
jgi:hypothetical protein